MIQGRPLILDSLKKVCFVMNKNMNRPMAIIPVPRFILTLYHNFILMFWSTQVLQLYIYVTKPVVLPLMMCLMLLLFSLLYFHILQIAKYRGFDALSMFTSDISYIMNFYIVITHL